MSESTPAAPPTILRPPTSAQLRDELEGMVLRDLLGPANGEEEEILDESISKGRSLQVKPTERYLVGMLAPLDAAVDLGELDEVAEAGNEDDSGTPPQSSMPQAPTMFPSSLGFTFSVSGEVAAIKVTASWGSYERTRSEQPSSEEAQLMAWKRTPHRGARVIPLVVGEIKPWSPCPQVAGQEKVHVKGLARKLDGDWVITLFLVNGQLMAERNRDASWIFQPELVVEAEDGSAIFRRRSEYRHDPERSDGMVIKDEQEMAMLYRNHVEFARGHGVGVHVETTAHDPACAVRLRTAVIPTHEVSRVTPPTASDIPALAPLALDMKLLAEADPATLPTMLTPLTDAYATWLATQQGRLEHDSSLSGHQEAARTALGDCERALKRISAGIALLASDAQAAHAFQFMNEAMWQQRIRTILSERTRHGERPKEEEIDTAANRSWRPFQLAFILLNLPSLTNLGHAERNHPTAAIADLLWFPTGGGKTEAYLGLTAYTLGLRRLQGVIEGRSGEQGVAVLMRYTLRLLTIQQFQRATALICACEIIRRRQPEVWGQTPFRLGLWVGQRTTPNKTEQADEAIRLEHGAGGPTSGGVGSPAQLTTCPWCGSKIDPGRDIVVDTKLRRRTFIFCSDPLGRCPFSRKQSPREGLPALVVDEEIYRLLPSLLIATVDKFAQMPWNGATAMLFGQVDSWCPRHGFRPADDKDEADYHPAQGTEPAVRIQHHNPLRPPDLIIQDELHLISGPLGTLVGLYETVVDRLASWQVAGQLVRPKVIASTATIRRSSDQIHALFVRRVRVFPPNGLDIEDNFFSRSRPASDEHPGRLYIGICAQGRRLKAALIRVYVAYMAAAQVLYEKYGKAADPWMTLIGYFNSMNELGGMRRLVDDDVRSRLDMSDRRGLAKRRPPNLEELTSRKQSADIPRVLDLLETQFDPTEESERRNRLKAGEQVNSRNPLDVLLATNMISVGVDVPRLGLMVVAGQPKTTSEYIQATSRIGRSFPGLVCTVFNWARPRDLSHYEQFEHYHDTFYKYVEPTSVTPFSARARDRGLSALLIAYVRLLGLEFNPNIKAGAITRNHTRLKEAVSGIVERSARITGNEDTAELVRQELEQRIDEWLNQAQTQHKGSILGYRRATDSRTVGLLQSPSIEDWELFTCLMSLRDVEPGVNLILDERGIQSDPSRPIVPYTDPKEAAANEA